VRALKREDLTKKGVESGSADAVEVSAKEYPVAARARLPREEFPKPRNMVGMVKGLPVEEMEKLILANSSVDERICAILPIGGPKPSATGCSRRGSGERLFLLPVQLAVRKTSRNPRRPGRVVFSLK
jgi:hypothetical protein